MDSPSFAVRLIAHLCLLFALTGCGTTLENRNPAGEFFPHVTGQSLEGQEVVLPDALRGRPAVLLIGYAQRAQFDADRWLLGLLQGELDVSILEVPTIKGFVPGLISDRIDSGMRTGIPSEDWSSVVTVYGDAERILELTGNTNPNNMRVMLLDAEGRIAWFHDRGYSARALLEMKARLEEGDLR